MNTSQIITYPQPTIDRADLALRCAPFNLALFVDMQTGAVALADVCGDRGIAKGYSRKALSELSADSYLQWLMVVGMLRREVDGQGLTDRFRLTPLGLQLSNRWQMEGNRLPQASLFDRLRNAIARWFRLPFAV
jgi:hypothetical protein